MSFLLFPGNTFINMKRAEIHSGSKGISLMRFAGSYFVEVIWIVCVCVKCVVCPWVVMLPLSFTTFGCSLKWQMCNRKKLIITVLLFVCKVHQPRTKSLCPLNRTRDSQLVLLLKTWDILLLHYERQRKQRKEKGREGVEREKGDEEIKKPSGSRRRYIIKQRPLLSKGTDVVTK